MGKELKIKICSISPTKYTKVIKEFPRENHSITLKEKYFIIEEIIKDINKNTTWNKVFVGAYEHFYIVIEDTL